jgi:hypothetical protein
MNVGISGADSKRQQTLRRAVTAVVAACVFLVVVAVPTDLIDTPWFSREISPTFWSWPSLVISSVLSGLLVATYVGPAADPTAADSSRKGITGGLLTFFAVGCPVCNKLVLVALGSAGAMSWFAPLQPLLALAGIAVLGWALRSRMTNQRSCPTTARRGAN